MKNKTKFNRKNHLKKIHKLNKRKWDKRFDDFKNKQPKKLCVCGCGNNIIIKRHHIRQGMPNFLPNHHSKMVLKGRSHTFNSRKNMSLGHTKEQLFTGFKRKLQERIRNSSKYQEWRLMVFGRDDFTCQRCGKRGTYLEAHHKKSFRSILKEHNIKNLTNALNCEQLWKINTGITYCKKCHIIIDFHRRGLKNG